MNRYIIPKFLSRKVVMTGVYFKHNHPGGISAVVQYWSLYIEQLQFYPTFKEGSKVVKILVFLTTLVRLFFRLLFDTHIEIVHVHSAAGTDFKRSMIIVNLAKLFKKKVIFHSHASQFKVFYDEADIATKQWILKGLRKANVLIVLSESWKDWFEKNGIDSNQIIILHNITAYPQLVDSSRKSIYPIRYLFMGEIGQRKGVFDIIRTLAKYKSELEGKIILRIGGNKNEDELLSAIHNCGVDQMVHFEGFVSGNKKNSMLNWADIYILPSYNEGLPISILEAMSYSMPIISTPVGGIPEVVDSCNGIIVTPGNDKEIYTAIRHYVDHTEDIALHGKESYRRVESYFPDYVLNHLKQIYKTLIDAN